MHHIKIVFISLVAIFIGFVLALIVASKKFIIFPSSDKQTQDSFTTQDPTKENKIGTQLVSKVLSTQQNLTSLEEKQNKLATDILTVQSAVATNTSSITALGTKKSILAATSVSNSSFTTNSVEFGPMGMWVNLNCSVSCNFWINFNTASRNQAVPNSSAGYLHSYELFIDGGDKSIGSEANLSVVNMSIPVSVNAFVSVAAGNHTVEIRSKTSGGTLESRNSYLQVMAIEK